MNTCDWAAARYAAASPLLVRAAQLRLQPRELIDCRRRLRGLRKQGVRTCASNANGEGSSTGNQSCKSVHRASLPIF